MDELGDYLKNFDEHGIFYCHNIESLHPDVYAVLKPQGIRSMLQCAMLDEGEFVGYVGFDECRENRAWNERQVAAFKLTANVLSAFLIKLREKQRRRNNMKSCENSRPCTCTFDCENHGKCCACVAHHRDHNEGVPGCFFSKEAEAAYDRSIEALARDAGVIK